MNSIKKVLALIAFVSFMSVMISCSGEYQPAREIDGDSSALPGDSAAIPGEHK